MLMQNVSQLPLPHNMTPDDALAYMPTLQQQFGQIDIYLFDKLLRGNIQNCYG
jgi:hypothetical protein